MSDRIGFARPSYRPEPANGLDPDMRRMAIVAAGLGGALFLVVGTMSLMHRGHHVVPVIEAMSGPVRIKPADPGGMKVMGADDAAPGAEKLAPEAERPQIATLRARVKAAHGAEAHAPIETKVTETKVTETKVTDTKVAEAKPTVIAQTPAPQKAAAMVAAPAFTAAPQAGEAKPSGIAVQLAAFDSPSAAEQDWGHLAVKMPELLAMKKPDVIRAQLAGRPVWRLRTGSFPTLADAANFCNRMRSHGGDCSIATF